LRRPEHSKSEVVVPKEEEDEVSIMINEILKCT
jgi:hypothetical protein